MQARATFVLVVLALAGGLTWADDKVKHADEKGGGHIVVPLASTKWAPAPPSLPPGAEMAILDGDPRMKGVPYTIRAKLPDGYKVPPHWHPVDENVTVLKGTLMMGRGDKFTDQGAMELTVGSFSHMPKGMRHFAWAKGETIIQVHGVGPFEIQYVNADDDPRKKAAGREP
jgi:quercetin dioxygenase-like cupin family protein